MTVTRRDLFLAFLRIGISGIGGVMPHAYHTLVERRRWLTEHGFLEVLSMGQILPGPNVANVAIMVGSRFHGASGALAALAGLLLLPFLIVLALAVGYQSFAEVAWVQQALRGISWAAAGLMASMGIRMAMVQPRRFWIALVAVTGFVAVALLQWPLVWVVLTLGPLGIACAMRWRA